MLKDNRPVDEQVRDFLHKYGSGDCKRTLQDELLDAIEKGVLAPVKVKEVVKDDTGKVIGAKVASLYSFDERVKMAKEIEQDLNKFIDNHIQRHRDKNRKKYMREHGGQEPPSDFDYDIGRVQTKEEKEHLERILHPPIDEKIRQKETDVKFAIDRVNRALKDNTKRQYIKNAQRKICELQDLQDEKLRKSKI